MSARLHYWKRFIYYAPLTLLVMYWLRPDSEIDEILKTQNYEGASVYPNDPITVITLRKDNSGNIRARSMSGFDVHTNQELFNFEVRL